MRRVALSVNGVKHDLEVEPRDLLAYVLRENGFEGGNQALPAVPADQVGIGVFQ